MVHRTSILVLASVSLILWSVLWAMLRRPTPPPAAVPASEAAHAPFAEELLSDASSPSARSGGDVALPRAAASAPAPLPETRAEAPRFCGQVLAREDSRPIAGARVLVADPPEEIVTDPQGRFELSPAAAKSASVEVRAAGFACVLLVPQSGHATPATSSPVLLARAAALRFHLAGPAGFAPSGIRVRAATLARRIAQPDGLWPGAVQGLADPSWSADTDVDGRCSLEDLPPDVPLAVEASRDGRVLRKETQPLTLRPGEVREIEWSIGTGCRLFGDVVDQAGIAVASTELWILRSEAEIPGFLVSRAEPRVVQRARTDAEGRYEFEDLAPGRWWIGPAPARTVESDAVASLAFAAEIPAGVAEIEQHLVVHRGLYIRGRVLDPAGEPYAKTAVTGTSDELALHDSASSDTEGRFAFGPLVPGRYTLTAFGGLDYADSDPQTVTAGDADVVLQVKPGAALVGTVLDGMSGKPCRARLTLTGVDPSVPLRMLAKGGEDGTFEIHGLRPGACNLAAHTEDARVGFVRNVQIVAGSTSTAPPVYVFPGARLRVRYDGNVHYGSFQILSEGVILGVDSLESGSSKTQGVAAGHLVVKFTTFDPQRTQQREIDLAVGQEKEILFTDG